ncbi:MAG: contractile injection system protein, VgrG/Pvc8 family [Pyrinomonadaceae bacterium]
MSDLKATILINDEEALDLLSSLIEMEVEQDHRMAAVARIKLSMPLDNDGTWRFLDDERVAAWNQLGITVLIEDTETELFKGYITQIKPHLVTDRNDCCLEITGLDATALMSLEEKIKDWPDNSDSDIARAVFQDYGLTPEVDDVEVIHEEAVSTIIQRETDIRFLMRLARRNGYECFVNGESGYFRKPVLDDPPQAVLAAHFGADTNLMSFHAKLNALRPTTVVMHQLDPIAKEVLDVTVDANEQTQLGNTAAGSLSVPDGRTPKVFVKHAVATGQPEMQNLSRALFDEAEWLIEGQGEINTIVYGAILETRKLVPIKGVGEAFSGLYYVTNVRHVFNVGGYTQHFTARRNALVAAEGDFEAGGLLGGLV